MNVTNDEYYFQNFLKVRRECNICQDLACDSVPNPYSSLIQQFVLCHLSHIEFGLQELLKGIEFISPQVNFY